MYRNAYSMRAYERQLPKLCAKCSRSFSNSTPAWAGHNKWSKTKHIKAVTDKKKMSERTAFTKLIAMYSKSKFLPIGRGARS